MLYWDPEPEIFYIPYLNFPILWYGLLFSVGFAIGFPIFISLLRRFYFNTPEYTESDILCPQELSLWGKTKGSILNSLNKKIGQEPPGLLPKRIKKFVLKSRCLYPQKALARLSLDLDLNGAVLGIYKKAVIITDRLVIYMLIATVVGARVGHFLFYENPADYFSNPWEILRIWEGGLASHGAAIAIILALILFSLRVRKMAKGLTWIRLLDFVAVPTALCGCFIRVGNFFNQEILGSPSSLPWAVTFGHPSDHSFPVPRHPVQLYEALFYLFVFVLLWRLSYRVRFILTQGKLIGLFLILVFGFRFLIEFLKIEQSHLLEPSSFLTMGQILSIPMVLLGLFFYFFEWPSKTSKAL